MVTRIVRMHFRAEAVESFLKTFNENKDAIRSFPGCSHMELLKDIRALNTFVTISYWDRPEDLENYRKSMLFESIWARTKPLFSAKAEAFSAERVE
jgi:heme-degrading monooxygenase HmoA